MPKELDDATATTVLATRALVAIAARSLAAVEDEVTLPQFRALVLLSTRGDQNVGTVADALGIHASSATLLCDRLVGKGLIARTVSPDNRREVTVTLSPAGQAMVRTVTASRARELRRVIARLDRTEQRKLIAAFEAFAAAAGELPDDGWKLGWTA